MIQSSRDEVLRFQGLDSNTVNWSWLTDKDRFSFQAFQSEYRIQEPLVRGSGLNKPDKSAQGLVASSWNTVLDMTAKAIQNSTPDRIAFVGGSRFTNESQYAWTKLAKGLIEQIMLTLLGRRSTSTRTARASKDNNQRDLLT